MCPVLVLLLAVPVLLFGFVESPSGFDSGGYVRCGLIDCVARLLDRTFGCVRFARFGLGLVL